MLPTSTALVLVERLFDMLSYQVPVCTVCKLLVKKYNSNSPSTNSKTDYNSHHHICTVAPLWMIKTPK